MPLLARISKSLTHSLPRMAAVTEHKISRYGELANMITESSKRVARDRTPTLLFENKPRLVTSGQWSIGCDDGDERVS